MKPITAVMMYDPHLPVESLRDTLLASGLVERILIVGQAGLERVAGSGCEPLPGSLLESATMDRLVDLIETEYMLFFVGDRMVSFEAGGLERLLDAADSKGAGMAYSDFYEGNGHEKARHPLNDYQPGSIRDNFDFGPVQLYSAFAAKKGIEKYKGSASTEFAALYDLRLRVSVDHAIHRVNEALYTISSGMQASGDRAMFAYVDPRNAVAQKEMEQVFTDYLKAVEAYLPSSRLRVRETGSSSFPVEASVIIPVRDRKGTIGEAAMSALSQETDFPFNVIVVDNRSTDGTTEMLSALCQRQPRLRHIVPVRRDLGIGGCWNDAIYSTSCGRYAVQLDSDDLYANTGVLQRIVDMLRHGGFAMVIGAYTLVDHDLKIIEPGLIDHREWSEDNGHNNALRINGLGAPRAFDTELVREIGFLNVSYGEDYAAALRICGEYKIGRIFDSLYLCRRWSGNTDAALTIEQTNRNDAFKDQVRTQEILIRQHMVRQRGVSQS
jgi:hypothetical protein